MTDMSVSLRISVLVALALLVTVLSEASASSGADTPFNTPCQVERTEIIFPRILTSPAAAAGGHSNHSWRIGSQMPATFLVALTWRGRQRVLKLFQSDVAAAKMVVVYEDTAHNDTVADVAPQENCYYNGFLKKESSSFAAVSTCTGLAGFIQTDDEMLFIEPAPAEREGGRLWEQRPHLIYTCKEKETPATNFTVPADVGEMPPVTADPRPRRRRRSTGRKRYLEVQMAVDHTVTALHGKERVKNYVMTLMNIANTVYQHHTLGVNIRVVVTELILLEKEEQKRVLIKRDAYQTVQTFCRWSNSRRSLAHAHAVKHDIAILLTRESLGPAGYAPITGLCNPSRSCAAITDEGFTTGFIIAHEMAHVFGLFHDGHGNACYGRKYATAIMAPLVEAKLNHYWWSECSKHHMQQVINYLYCLDDDPDFADDVKHYNMDSGAKLPNDLARGYSLNFQCRLEFGGDFGHCPAFSADGCDMLWCSDRSTPHLCRTKRGPPAPGSICGREMECRDRRCMYVGRENAVHGNWSEWSEWGQCSVECGTGIKRRRRFCNNPSPAYGGRECEGESESWDTCVAKECTATYDDVREGHCSVWNDMNIRSGQHDWKAYQAKRESDLCKQTCVSSSTGEVVTINVEVSDGTPCDYDNPTNICYLGKCLSVGCDGVQNSTKVFDSCGICGGDDSQCKVVSGRITRVPSSGDEYESVVYLPKGARNILIEKEGRARHFIALLEPNYGRYPLNGDKRLSRSRDFILVGARFEYKVKHYTQTLKSVGPTYADLEVMLYPNRDLSETSVTYEYSVHKSDNTLERMKYKWVFRNWTECSVTCGEGETSVVHVCYDKYTEEMQPDEACKFIDPPRKDVAPCKREPCSRTKYLYAMTNDWSECSAEKCGEQGVEKQGYECQRYFMDNDTYVDAPMDMCDPDDVPDYTRNCTAPPCKKLKWTKGKWSECSVTCGRGKQTRTAYCGDPDTDSDDIYCKNTPPRLSRNCKKKPCKDKPSSDECGDKYSFCSRSQGLTLKCRSKRFSDICCKSCKRGASAAARSPRLSNWVLYRLRMLRLKKRY